MTTLAASLAVGTFLSSGGLIHLLIGLLILACVIYVVFLVLGMLPIPQPIKNILCIILGLIFLLVLLNYLGFAF